MLLKAIPASGSLMSPLCHQGRKGPLVSAAEPPDWLVTAVLSSSHPPAPQQGLGWPFLPPCRTSMIFHHSGTKSLKGRAIIRASPSHREHCKATNDRDREHWTSLRCCCCCAAHK